MHLNVEGNTLLDGLSQVSTASAIAAHMPANSWRNSKIFERLAEHRLNVQQSLSNLRLSFAKTQAD
jgi:aspartokinase